MAATARPQDALVFVKQMIKRMPIDDPEVSVTIMDQANKMIWMAAPWRWTIRGLTNVTTAVNTQDYTVTLPADFLYLHDAYLSNGSDITRELTIEPWLNDNVVVTGNPSRVAVQRSGSNDILRTYPRSGASIPANQQVVLRYKVEPPTITGQNQATPGVLVMDDAWFWVYISAVLYFAYLYADDQRAGGAQTDARSGGTQFTGQRAIVEANINAMREREKLPLPLAKDFEQKAERK